MDKIESDILGAVLREVRALMNERSDHIVVTGCENFPEYQRQRGIVEGLAIAEREILDLVKLAEEAD